MIGAAGSIGRAKALRNDALAAERAGLLVDDRAVVFEMALNAIPGSSAQQALEGSFAHLDRLASQILAIELK